MALLIFSLPVILHFCRGTQQSDKLPIKLDSYFAHRQTQSIFHVRQLSPMTVYFLRRRQHQHCYQCCYRTCTTCHGVVDSDWIIASVLLIICARCFPYSRDGEAPVEKMAPRRECNYNEDWRRDFAWIAKLPDNGMAQCNL